MLKELQKVMKYRKSVLGINVYVCNTDNNSILTPPHMCKSVAPTSTLMNITALTAPVRVFDSSVELQKDNCITIDDNYIIH